MITHTPVKQELFVSLILCTRNRCQTIPLCLNSIKNILSHSTIKCEVIIVNNGSTDATQSLLEAWASSIASPIKIIFLPTGGLAAARNVGVENSSGNFLAFTDDDCALSTDYLEAIAVELQSLSCPAIIGGRIELGNPLDLPVTIKTDQVPAVLRPGQSPGGFIMGANMMMPLEIYRRIGGFDERFGAGGKYLSAEDTDYVFRAVSNGLQVRYCPQIFVSHFHGRRNPDDIKKLEFGYCYGDGALLAKYFLSSNWARLLVLKNIYWLLRDSTSAIATLNPTKLKRAFFKFTSHFKGFIQFILSR